MKIKNLQKDEITLRDLSRFTGKCFRTLFRWYRCGYLPAKKKMVKIPMRSKKGKVFYLYEETVVTTWQDWFSISKIKRKKRGNRQTI